MTQRHQLGELQLAIMRVLWAHPDGATVLQVHAGLGEERELSASTVGTMLQKMERKGVVRHRQDGRRYRYLATVAEEEVRRSMVGELTRRLFGGDARALLGHLLRHEEIDGSDLDVLHGEIARRELLRGDERPRPDGDESGGAGPAEARS